MQQTLQRLRIYQLEKGPDGITFSYDKNKIFVTNFYDNTVSVINATDYTKIKDIPVGKGPVGITYSDEKKMVYVSNFKNNTVSVINATDSTKIKDIPVGKGPVGITFVSYTDRVYVTNTDSDTVSVINATDNENIKDIPVGRGPKGITFDYDKLAIYFTNSLDNSVSIIDPITKQVIKARVMFNVEPFNAGHIECDKDKIIVPLLQQFYLYEAKCTAKPNQGFEFVGWQKNLTGNLTQWLKLTHASSILDSFLDFFNMKSDKEEAILNATDFGSYTGSYTGSFTANFKALPSPIPTEYIATLFSVVYCLT
jgi:YVTN family beta-propeller protein